MSTHADTHDRTDFELPSTADDEEVAHLLEHAAVDVEPRPDATACGAAGCHGRECLVRILIRGFGKRVLCPIHAAKFLRRELGER